MPEFVEYGDSHVANGSVIVDYEDEIEAGGNGSSAVFLSFKELARPARSA
jgi:hypothetical protein